MNRNLTTLAAGGAMLALILAGCGGGATSADAAPDAQVSAAVRASAHEAEPQADVDEVVPRFRALLGQLRAMRALEPMFGQYAVPRPLAMDDDHAGQGLIALLRSVKIVLSDGVVTITNRETGALIFTAPLADLASGEFHAENLPGVFGGSGPAPETCTYTYSEWSACQADGTQTRTVAAEMPMGCAGVPVLSQPCTTPPSPTPTTCAAFTYSDWGACQPDGTQTRTVVAASPANCSGGAPTLTQACTYEAPVTACTAFTYSGWGACQPDGTQTRTVASASPAGCTGGTPELTQACVYTAPLDGAALYGQSCAGCHGPLATSNLKGRGMTVDSIKARRMTQGLSDAQLQAIVDAVGP